ncbi:ATP-binding cassette sub-family C member 9 [Callorhinchus milii]|uniref:ATP-binding cassette sub-family C member 9 n=1 Tax=Callorhinchus milii TaxID=7868 RepID=UPI001C3FCD5B|nr:ATP-binding cassette sub-family C member 9 [Callorhinchus milii]
MHLRERKDVIRMENVWNLFCGVTEKNTTFPSKELNLIEDLCFTEGVNILLHAGLVIFSIFGIFATRRKKRTPLFHSDSLLRGWVHFPWHNCRWLLTFVYIFLSMCCLWDGILSQRRSTINRPFLYTVDAVQLLSSILSIMYYDAVEKANDPLYLLLFICHWPTACGINVFKVYQLYLKNLTIYHLTFSLTCILVVVYGLFIILELCAFFQLGYLGPWYSRRVPPLELQDASRKFHQPYVNTFSQITYSWISWLLKEGSHTPIQMETLGKLSQQEMGLTNFQVFKRSYDKQMETISPERMKSGDLGKVYFKAFGKPFLIGAVLKIIGDLAGLIAPLCIDGILRFVADDFKYSEKGSYFVSVWEFISNGYILTFLMLSTMLLQNICLQLSYYIVIREGMHIRASLQSMIYKKALLLPVWVFSGGLLTVGQIMNYMSIDSLQIMMAAFLGFYIVSIPIQIVLAVILLYFQLGISALVGISVILLLAPLQYFISKKFASIQKRTMECSDERIKKSNEMLHCIKLLKLYSWEGIFASALKEARQKEMKYMLKGSFSVISTLFLTQVTPIIATLVAFSTYSAFTGSPLTANKAFSALALFDKFNSPLIIFPVIVRMIVNTVLSTHRLASYFSTDELKGMGTTFIESKKADEPLPPAKNADLSVEQVQLEDETIPENSTSRYQSADHPDEPQNSLLNNHSNNAKPEESTVDDVENPTNSTANALEITNGSFAWSSNSEQICLQDISTKIPEGKITILVGKVGSGKTSLLSAMLGEMTTVSGNVKWATPNQPIAYSAQAAWLRNASLQNNIVLEEEFDEERFNMVIDACALQPDIDILPAREQTEIGEKGINLSGGQKQRVSVARALYSRCSVVILDDPLSALDVHVGSRVFHQGIMGVLKKEGRTVIIVTHHLEYLKEADHIIVMENGMIDAQGTYWDISTQNPDLVQIWKTLIAKEDNEGEEEGKDDNFEEAYLQMEQKPGNVDGKLVQDEEKEEGSISIRVYWLYIRSIGIFFFFGLLFAVIIKQSFFVAIDFWLADWSSAGTLLIQNKSRNESVSRIENQAVLTHYLNGYIGLTCAAVITALFSSIAHVLSGIKASKYLFRKMLVNVMALPLRFFESTPIGRILNRFSSDIKAIDDQIPTNLERFLWHLLLCLSAVLINIIICLCVYNTHTPNLTCNLMDDKIRIVNCFSNICKKDIYCFLAHSRELQRLDSITKSPVFAHFSETLGGLTTIRAYKCEDKFFEQIVDKIDYNNIAYLYLNTINRWLAIRLDFIGTTIVFAATLCALVTAELHYLEDGLVGLAILHALKMSTFLNWSVREMAELEMQMNSVERVHHYTELKTERQLKESMMAPVSISWPRSGKIEIYKLSVRYADHLDPVLHNLTLTIEAGTTVGICGRTGSGKSSLSLSLLRIIDNYKAQPMPWRSQMAVLHGVAIQNKYVFRISQQKFLKKITILVGKVGSGKTSLLSAMLGEMTTVSGNVKWATPNQPIAYSAQAAWLRNASLQNNIVLEEEFDEERFNMVIDACALQPDIDILPAREQTEIGEKGINLSGGQKQRVSVARALYSRCSVVILDDPLSALDVHVGSRVFHQGIMGVLKKEGRTVIIVTHHLEYLKEADHIIVMENGMIDAQGTYWDISTQNPDLVQIWKTLIAKECGWQTGARRGKRRRIDLHPSLLALHTLDWHFLLLWFTFCSNNQAKFFVAIDFWLADWSSAGTLLIQNKSRNESVSRIENQAVLTHYLNGYIGLTCAAVITALFSSIAHVLSGIKASKYLFRKMLVNVMALPLRFFESTPIGRILNRFSSDIKAIDDQIPTNLERFLWHLLLCLSAVLINIIVTPFFIIPILPLLVFYYFLQKFFRASSRELQRLDSITKSPVFAHFSETLGGLTTIRAYKCEDKFFEQIVDKIDYNNIAYLYLNTINRWLAIRLDFIGTTIVFAATLCALVTAELHYLEDGLVGLAILHALKMSTFLNWSVREMAELEMQMNSVERVHHYTELKTERQLKESMMAPVSISWPRSGKIEIYKLSVRYADHLDPVLHNLTLTIEAGTTVGICGRTGSGKSSLSLSLLRIIDNYKGYIKIGGIDISTVSLAFLRRAISIIPQDPVLFGGSVRFNLDPESDHSDEELWEVLQIAQLDQFVSELPEKLDSFIAESSENLSMGQRQLLCIARALLRKSKIIILDEATASVDMETDSALQIVMKTAFKNSTVLIIAHRIQTIIDCERVIVMHQGQIVEDGDPKVLQNNDSFFAKLVKASN